MRGHYQCIGGCGAIFSPHEADLLGDPPECCDRPLSWVPFHERIEFPPVELSADDEMIAKLLTRNRGCHDAA